MNLIISEPHTTWMIDALNRREALTLAHASDGSQKPVRMGFLSRIWHFQNPNFHHERLTKLASIISKIISQQQRLSIADAAMNRPLKAARALLKEIGRHNIHSPEINSLRKEVTAAKLGISAHTLDENPGLQKFTEDHHLERYLLIYKHALQVDSNTQQISLLKNGSLQPWNTVDTEIQSWKKPCHQPQLAWIYGQKGIQQEDMYDWTTLKPFMKGNPADWDNQYVFEFCSCHNPHSFKNGNHSWLRLKTPSGDIYSVGLYRPDKMDWKDNLRFPLRIKPGHLMQPDVSEFWDYEITTVDFSISEETFFKIKQTIEEDKENEDLVFQLFNNNCLLYNKKLARLGGVDLPTLDNVMFYMAPLHIVQKVAGVMDKLPTFVQKICLYVSAFFLNIGQIFLGATIIDGKLNEKQKQKAVPHLNSFSDLFDVSKIYLNHPNTLGYKTRQTVLEWREKEIDLLNLTEKDPHILEKKIKEINLKLPPAYYTYA